MFLCVFQNVNFLMEYFIISKLFDSSFEIVFVFFQVERKIHQSVLSSLLSKQFNLEHQIYRILYHLLYIDLKHWSMAFHNFTRFADDRSKI